MKMKMNKLPKWSFKPIMYIICIPFCIAFAMRVFVDTLSIVKTVSSMECFKCSKKFNRIDKMLTHIRLGCFDVSTFER